MSWRVSYWPSVRNTQKFNSIVVAPNERALARLTDSCIVYAMVRARHSTVPSLMSQQHSEPLGFQHCAFIQNPPHLTIAALAVMISLAPQKQRVQEQGAGEN